MYSKRILILSILLVVCAMYFLYSCSDDAVQYPVITPTPIVTPTPTVHPLGVGFTSPVSYDIGLVPSIAGCHKSSTFVETHIAAYSTAFLWYHVGNLTYDSNGNPKVTWGPGHQLNSVADTPSICISENNVVVEVHNGYDSNQLYYRVGIADGVNYNINWGPEYNYDNGFYPCIAISPDGKYVAVVYQHSNTGNINNEALWYHTGTVDSVNKTIDWAAPVHYNDYYGSNPGISLNEVGSAFITQNTEKSGGTGTFCLGQLTGTNLAVGGAADFSTGAYNYRSCFFDTNAVIVVGECLETSGTMNLYYKIGETTNTSVNWFQAMTKYGTGEDPCIMFCNGSVMEVHSTESGGPRCKLWYSFCY